MMINRQLILLSVAVLCSLFLSTPPADAQGVPEVTATVETDPVPSSSDAADDIAIWLHPTDRSLSTIIGTDKTNTGGLAVYDLSGRQLHFYPDGNMNNVDLRYHFPLGNEAVTLVGATNRTTDTLDFYKVEVADRSLTKVGAVRTSTDIRRGRGFAMYRSPATGIYYAFVTDFETNIVEQYELSGATGSVSGKVVRSFDNGDSSEGMVIDDELQALYVAEEDVGVWRYGAEPRSGLARTLVDTVETEGGHLTANVKGLAIYYSTGGEGYLIAASQGNSSFQLYRRSDGAFVGQFRIGTGEIDRVNGQDGIDVTNYALSAEFPEGVFVSQDFTNDDSNQNFKLVPWHAIAASQTPPLIVDTAANPYQLAAPVVTPAVPLTPVRPEALEGSPATPSAAPEADDSSSTPGGDDYDTSMLIVIVGFGLVTASVLAASGLMMLKR
jgi:myo-inositol-hexaphosphate 3-phosphohydrolase